jgi:hypothetical protein
VTCQEYEPLIALYVEGDVNEPGIEQHLAQCSGCRELLEDLQASQSALKELGSVDAAFLSAVRSGALAKMERRRLPVWPLAWAFAIALLLILAIPRTPPATGRAAADPAVIQAPVPVPTVAHASPKPRKSRARLRTRKSAPAEPLVVKMLTDDPNIVIIWLVDRTGD